VNSKKKISKKHFIFDLDGVLFNSLSNMEYSWNKVKKKNNLKTSFAEYKKYIGLPFKKILINLGIKDNYNKIQHDYFLNSKKNISKIKLYPNVKKILEILKKKNKILSIVTSKKRSNALILINKIGIKFDYIKTENKKFRGKPNPDLLNLCIKKSKIKKKLCVYVGDMAVDCLTAKRAKIDFILADYGYGSNMKKCKKILKFSNLLDIYD
tara:strand:- start:382 stop:1011 length:630 start_codon:yes stop_codon:yes gene_type:complete